jgi:ornithine cyclodeaminase
MIPIFINKEKVAELLPMNECIEVMEKTFRSLAAGECLQPLRSLMWLPDKSGILGMMPGYAAGPGVMGVKVISVFPANKNMGLPSHQGVVILFDAKNGEPLLIADAEEITAIRTAAASALATRLLSKEDSSVLAVIGSGVQARRHIEAMLLVRKIKQIRLCSRNENNAIELGERTAYTFGIPVSVQKNTPDAVAGADIICTVTAATQPVVRGDWISPGAHLNVVGSCTPAARELDTNAIIKASLFTDNYESLFNEAGDFIIPQKEGAIDKSDVKGDISEVLTGAKPGRMNSKEITIFKSLGIAAEDIFAAWHIYEKVNPKML